MVHVVFGVANQYPHFLFNSCQEHGGNWEFMDTLIDTLRLEDTRWGYGWKRGVVGDPLLDIVSYNWSSDPDEGHAKHLHHRHAARSLRLLAARRPGSTRSPTAALACRLGPDAAASDTGGGCGTDVPQPHGRDLPRGCRP